ncbi:competence/damage-inducible protein A [Pseudonocardia sp. TMWB2A]|uniref:competence/damage-inducible protein A n=1 Tax=Pseudonocardia sp. TMWB2A TaxID=687430 RepID=UPI00307E16C2
MTLREGRNGLSLVVMTDAPSPPSGSPRIWTAGIAIIGDEILSGRTQDKNIAQIASWLNVQGIRLREVRVVPDVEDEIVAAVNALRARYDYIFTTGGIGPTHDDITVDAIAKALGVGVVIHPEARATLERYYTDRGGLNEGRLRMARVPDGADLIPNPMSGAPGIRIGNLFIMAGVPHITAGMLAGLDGSLEGGAPLQSVTLGAFAPESEIAAMLEAAERNHNGCQVGSYPFYRQGKVGGNFVVRSTSLADAQACAAEIAAGLVALGYDYVAGGIE